MPNNSELDEVEVKFFSESLGREVEVNCVYKFYPGMTATRLDPHEDPERDFHSIIEIGTGEELFCDLSDEDFETINEKIDELMSGREQ